VLSSRWSLQPESMWSQRGFIRLRKRPKDRSLTSGSVRTEIDASVVLLSVGFLRMRDANNVPYKSQPVCSGKDRDTLPHPAFLGYLSFANCCDISYHYRGNEFPACTKTEPCLLALDEVVASSVTQRGQTISQPHTHTHVRLLLQGQKLYLAILKQVHTIQLKAFEFLPSAQRVLVTFWV